VDAVHSGATDIGVVMEGAEAPGLQLLEYRTDTLVAVVPKKHPLRARRVAFEKLLDQDFVGLESNTVISQMMLAQANHAGKPLRLRVQVKSFDVVARLIQAGLGIGLLPEGAAQAFSQSMGLRAIALTDAWATRKMYLCVRQYASLPAAARQLVDCLLERSRSAKGRLPE
jgi:DNA-binding transcriptional LysR family regulator